jgi:para-nitrobenzyl esterase
MKTGGKPVYRYLYARVRPRYLGMPGQAAPTAPEGGPEPRGAAHSAEIQYAMGNLDLDPRYTWTAEDRKVSEIIQGYFANFIKTGNPNGPGLPNWPAYDARNNYMRMRIDVVSGAEAEPDRGRYGVLDAIAMKQQ